MELGKAYDGLLTDCHIHYPHMQYLKKLMQICELLNIGKFNVVCTPHRKRLSLVPDALHLKANYPGRVFVFGCPDVSNYFLAPGEIGTAQAEYVELLMEAGCDGVKMIEGKPDMRKMLSVPPFDSEAFQPYWEKLSKDRIPLLMHVNDPEEFWDDSRIPGTARERGWFYGDGSYINNESQYAELINVLENHPGLQVIFAHFFFLSNHLARLSELLERFPNIFLDLAPGAEMYRNFSKNVEKAREFFLRFQDRILFATDIGALALLENAKEGDIWSESKERVLLIRQFLENEGQFSLDGQGKFLRGYRNTIFKGLGLTQGVLEKIYHRNYEAFVGSVPRSLNAEAVIEICSGIEEKINIMGSSHPNGPGDPSVAKHVRLFFQEKL